MTEPNRCPFCGAISVFIREVEPGRLDLERWVECGYCNARGPIVKGDRAQERAVSLWNNAQYGGRE